MTINIIRAEKPLEDPEFELQGWNVVTMQWQKILVYRTLEKAKNRIEQLPKAFHMLYRVLEVDSVARRIGKYLHQLMSTSNAGYLVSPIGTNLLREKPQVMVVYLAEEGFNTYQLIKDEIKCFEHFSKGPGYYILNIGGGNHFVPHITSVNWVAMSDPGADKYVTNLFQRTAYRDPRTGDYSMLPIREATLPYLFGPEAEKLMGYIGTPEITEVERGKTLKEGTWSRNSGT